MKIGIIGTNYLAIVLKSNLRNAGQAEEDIMMDCEVPIACIAKSCEVVFFTIQGSDLLHSMQALEDIDTPSGTLWIDIGPAGVPMVDEMRDVVADAVCLRFFPSKPARGVAIESEEAVIRVISGELGVRELYHWLIIFLVRRKCTIITGTAGPAMP